MALLTTTALDLLRTEITLACDIPGSCLLVSVPPQEGLKTSLLREICVGMLTSDRRQLLYTSYSTTVASMQGRLIANKVDADKGSDCWRIKRSGQFYCCGPDSALLGRMFDVVVVDDPLRNIYQARERVVRENLHEWWSESVMLKLAPGASVVVVCSRTHPDDLYGHLKDQGWPSLNIPALADGDAPDALQRPVGTWLESIRGRTARDWKQLRTEMSCADFASLYQGCPT